MSNDGMKIIPVCICYLCGKPILPEQESNKDHVVPKVLLQKKQPKIQGFDYGGKLITHQACNNKFGEGSSNLEVICKKALDLLYILLDEKCYIKRYCKGNPNLGLLVLDSTYLKGFTNRDLEFFGINDVRNKEYTSWSNVSYLETLEPINPRIKPTNIALTVLAKSSAAILVSRYKVLPDSTWKITVYPGLDDDDSIDMNDLMGRTQPFDIGVKVWIRNVSNEHLLVAYKHKKIITFFNFSFFDDTALDNILPMIFPNREIFQYRSNNLIDLVGYDWFKNSL